MAFVRPTVWNVPAQRPEFPPLLDNCVEVDEAEKQLLESGRLLAGLEKLVTGDWLQVVRALHVGSDTLSVWGGEQIKEGVASSHQQHPDFIQSSQSMRPFIDSADVTLSVRPLPYLGRLIGHLDSVLEDIDRELGAGITRHPQPDKEGKQ